MRPAVTGVAMRQGAMVAMGKSSARVSARSCTMDQAMQRIRVQRSKTVRFCCQRLLMPHQRLRL